MIKVYTKVISSDSQGIQRLTEILLAAKEYNLLQYLVETKVVNRIPTNLLLNHTADPNIGDLELKACLQMIIKLDIAKQLLSIEEKDILGIESRADLTIIDGLIWYCSKTGKLAILELIESFGFNIIHVINNQTRLVQAIETANIELARWALTNGDTPFEITTGSPLAWQTMKQKWLQARIPELNKILNLKDFYRHSRKLKVMFEQVNKIMETGLSNKYKVHFAAIVIDDYYQKSIAEETNRKDIKSRISRCIAMLDSYPETEVANLIRQSFKSTRWKATLQKAEFEMDVTDARDGWFIDLVEKMFS